MTGNLPVLLTGATGLVGRFLLVELLRRHIPTIVLVRSQPLRQANVRVDEALRFFEQHNQLPRPLVLEGDLTTPGLGLSAQAWAALKSQPLRVVHSAASIRFESDSPDGEPYRTNVNGTGHLLEAARQLQITQFHHISTAYVQCDRRNGLSPSERTAYEVAVTGEQRAGNDYERSKIRSEQMVLACGHIGPVTIYRPSIVVGDSQSGYTSTYHGFYAPLQIGAGLVRLLGLDYSIAELLTAQLGLTDRDSKNLVPVDWLAAAIVHLMETPAALGGIYHLTHPTPASLSTMQEAILAALSDWPPGSGATPGKRTSREHIHGTPGPVLPPELAEGFRQQMQVYRSYFQGDPPFNRQEANRFLAQLPCPLLDRKRLTHLARVALDQNFGWPRPACGPTPTAKLVVKRRPESHSLLQPGLEDAHFNLEVLGPNQWLDRNGSGLSFYRQFGQWRLNSMLSSSVPGSGMRLVTTEKSLRRALADPQLVPELFEQGRWTLRGPWPLNWLEIVRDWLEHIGLEDDANPDQGII